jgi:hypothetical protein
VITLSEKHTGKRVKTRGGRTFVVTHVFPEDGWKEVLLHDERRYPYGIRMGAAGQDGDVGIQWTITGECVFISDDEKVTPDLNIVGFVVDPADIGGAICIAKSPNFVASWSDRGKEKKAFGDTPEKALAALMEKLAEDLA